MSSLTTLQKGDKHIEFTYGGTCFSSRTAVMETIGETPKSRVSRCLELVRASCHGISLLVRRWAVHWAHDMFGIHTNCLLRVIWDKRISSRIVHIHFDSWTSMLSSRTVFKWHWWRGRRKQGSDSTIEQNARSHLRPRRMANIQICARSSGQRWSFGLCNCQKRSLEVQG